MPQIKPEIETFAKIKVIIILLSLGLFFLAITPVLAEDINDLLPVFHTQILPNNNGTIFLPQDCSIYGTWDEPTSTCTLNQDLFESVEITTDNTTLDCDNHSITGTGTGYGIRLSGRIGVTVENCIISNFAVGLGSTEYVYNINIIGNTFSNNDFFGLDLIEILNSNIIGNQIFNNWVGVHLWPIIGPMSPSNNYITENTISNNEYGIVLELSLDNFIYHNNFINNLSQAIDFEGTNNLFDNSYPDGGNYWSDYTGVDLYSGLNQDQPGSDGIGDTSHTFPGGEDRYPFMEESGWEIVELPLSTKAAILAKELVNYSYLYGGKGWDYNLSQFVAADTVKTGYTFWNQEIESTDFGAGVDCSGLIMWAYDRSFDPTESRFNNFVKAEGADEQYRYNTEATTEAQLQPGDVMFFDWDLDEYIDHVAMYVGESGGYDVVNARSRELGIRGMSKDILKELSGFVAFKQVISAPRPTILISARSPVDFAVTDPDGFTITPTTNIPSDVEFLRQIPGVLYYSEMERGADGRPIDQVYSYTVKTGNYLINILPEPDALPTDTYSLELETLINGEIITTILAEDVPISEIPEQPYLVKVTETEVIPATPMKSFTTKKMKIHWKDKTKFTISGSFELPDEYQKEDLDKSAFLSIQIADKIGKDKVILKERKNLWRYREPWRRKKDKIDDSLGQGIDIKTMLIHWLSEKECKVKWWCKKKPKFKKNWFYVRGELSLEGIDVNTLPREATLILEIPTAPNEESGILAGIETIEFKKFRHSWFYHLPIKWKDWRDDWWKKWDND